MLFPPHAPPDFQPAAGYVNHLLPPLIKAMDTSDPVPHRIPGPGTDNVVNIVTASDVGA